MDLSSNEVWRKTLNFSLSKKILVISRQLNLFPAKRKFCGEITTSWRFSRSLMSSKALLLIQPKSKENSLLRLSSKIESSILTRIQRKNHPGPLAWYLQDFYTQNFSTCDSFLKISIKNIKARRTGDVCAISEEIWGYFGFFYDDIWYLCSGSTTSYHFSDVIDNTL